MVISRFIFWILSTVTCYSLKFYVQSVRKKGTPLLIHIKIIAEKLILINTDYCPLQFDAIIFFLMVRLHGGVYVSLIFFNINPKFDNKIAKFTDQIARIQIFKPFLTLFWQLLDVGIMTNANFLAEKIWLKY